MNFRVSKETVQTFLNKHWQNGNIFTILVGVFTFLLFAEDFARYMSYLLVKTAYKSVYDYVSLHYTTHTHLVFRLFVGVTLLPVVALGAYFIYRLFRVLQKGSLQQRAANFWGVSRQESYEKALLRQFIITLVIFAFFSAMYYVLKWLVPQYFLFFRLQLILSWFLIIALIFQFYASAYVVKDRLLPFAARFFTEPLSAYNLAIFRILMLKWLKNHYNYRVYDTAYWAAMPPEARVDLPYMGWFIQHIPISPEIYLFMGKLGIILSTMAMWGLFTRPALLLNIPVSIYVLGVPMFFGKLAHQQMWVWFPAILAFSRCADVLSVDWLINKYIRKKTPLQPLTNAAYALPFKFIWLHYGIIYFYAGIVKISQCGLDWALGKSMINQIQLEWLQNYDMIPAFRIDYYPVLAHAGGLGVIIMELFYPFLVLSSLTRIISFLAGLSFHNTAAYFMNIGFEDLQRTYVSYINFAGIFNWIKAKLPFPQFAVEMPPQSGKASRRFSDAWQLPSFKAVFYIGTFLFGINFMCGLLRIHSWPFSSYPTYSRIVYDYHWYVYYDSYDKDKNALNLYELGKKANHRMETYTPIEDRIFENYNAKDTATLRKNIGRLWEIWIDNVPALKENTDSVVVYLRKSPIAPEIKDSITEEHLLAKIINDKIMLLPAVK
ncbi:hypothetical protein C7N43_29285 [Sphingobacteriales bacterium UPWRP_1]|nr:hypothetical protein BVG80_18365 [Sphingobacteriales bacterium TSM_CSM]PSJ73396.1 hypothetical protein C7N43_29285 [Sphingobacteriales bacterium UPWRP_1]